MSHLRRSTSLPTKLSTAKTSTFFGIPQPSGAPANFDPSYDDNYETRFPPDPIYQEATENARVYRVYMEESAKYDAYMTEEGREGLDMNLVFAGLFSAVLTTFVAQTSQSLQPDRATESTLLLREIAALQRAQINGTSVDSIPTTPVDFTPSSIDVWVNGLWFASLTLSLVSALLAVLIKQWIRHYMLFTSGTPRERSLIRQFRFMGLQKWHVPTLIGILPVLMHLSLAIFFAGLTLFLISLRRSIASIVGSASALVFLAYIGATVWPLFQIQCPYRTPLNEIIHGLFQRISLSNSFAHLKPSTLQSREHENAVKLIHDLDAHAFEWLISMSSNPSVHRAVVQAVGGLSRNSSRRLDTVLLRSSDSSFRSAYNNLLSASLSQSRDIGRSFTEKADLLERLFRIPLHPNQVSFTPSPLDDALKACQSSSARTLKWRVTATAFQWRHRRAYSPGQRTIVGETACALLGRLVLKPGNDATRLSALLFENLLDAASSCPRIVIPGWPDVVHDPIISTELERRVCQAEWGRSTHHDDDGPPISFENALCTNDNFVWSLLWPYDNHKENSLDSERVQWLLSLVNVFSSRGPSEVRHDLFFGTWKEIICELQAESVSPMDREAIFVAADAFLQQRTIFQDAFGPNAILLPSLSFLYCWTPRPTSRSERTDVVLALVEIDMFRAINKLESIGGWLWSVLYGIRSANNTAPVASLIASVIRPTLQLQIPHPDQARWLDYLSLPDNSAAFVAMLTFQGSTRTPASVEQVRDDLLLFFASRSWDYELLRQCRASLEEYLQYFVPGVFRDDYRANMKEARKIIDELITKQSPNANPFSRFLRHRSVHTVDSDAIMMTQAV